MFRQFITGQVPSSKNSKRWTGKMLIGSKPTLAYKKDAARLYAMLSLAFRNAVAGQEKPYRIGFFFHRKDKRRFDYINIAQIVLDMMVEHGWIDDDNASEVLPVFMGFRVDRGNPGVMIELLDS